MISPVLLSSPIITGSIWAVNLHWLDKVLTKIFFFSGTWFMLSDGTKRKQYKREHHRRHHLPFLDNMAVVLNFLELQDKYNTCPLPENIKCICSHQRLDFYLFVFVFFFSLALSRRIVPDDIPLLSCNGRVESRISWVRVITKLPNNLPKGKAKLISTQADK